MNVTYCISQRTEISRFHSLKAMITMGRKINTVILPHRVWWYGALLGSWLTILVTAGNLIDLTFQKYDFISLYLQHQFDFGHSCSKT